MKKWTNIILMLLLILPFVHGEICDLEPILPNTVCTLVTPATTSTTYDIYGENGSLIENGSLTTFNDSIKYFNFSQNTGSYIIRLNNLNETRELVVKVSGDQMASSWLAIILALGLMTGISSFFAVRIKERKLESVKVLLFLFSISNAFMIGITSWIISANPGDVTAFKPVAIVWLGATGLVFVCFIWLYGFYLVERGLDHGD